MTAVKSRSRIHVIPIRLRAVNLWSLSAHTLPVEITLSNVETCASLAAFAAALNRLTFCCGLSPGGPGIFGGPTFEGLLELECPNLAEAWGIVDVNRVASVADRGMLRKDQFTQLPSYNGVGGLVEVYIYIWTLRDEVSGDFWSWWPTKF